MGWFELPDLAVLEGKVVVLTGGSLGIGAALVEHLYISGARVFFGDVLEEPATQLVERLTSSRPTDGEMPRIAFVRTDVSSYEDNLRLFDAAFSNCGRVDHAISVAAIGTRGRLCEPSLTLDTIREPIPTKIIDVNLTGVSYFTRIASVYLRQAAKFSGSPTNVIDKSIVLVSSVAGFIDSPGIELYQATKHGVLGLMRSLRSTLINSSPNPIRINAICPWFTETRLAKGVSSDWHANNLPVNQPIDVAKIIAGTMAASTLNGAALFVTGGRAWDVERGIDELQSQWLGEENHRAMVKGQAVLGNGDSWNSGLEGHGSGAG
ncbi:putative 3-hydroxyacyl-CoA dehydrogenase [Viridothelium virens]|uniref:Putative 3-hydroxyacyl-CoA dehydrogenase n=1 Tax=Viridothelium virens TaxID=1048519 RepID=A0A6A6HLF7_VIRVR|nr:putative 3-hydroxyacyl-CoA dehydrogenase [Viridothelium virens]